MLADSSNRPRLRVPAKLLIQHVVGTWPMDCAGFASACAIIMHIANPSAPDEPSACIERITNRRGHLCTSKYGLGEISSSQVIRRFI